LPIEIISTPTPIPTRVPVARTPTRATIKPAVPLKIQPVATLNYLYHINFS
jgi:hypothetical protein